MEVYNYPFWADKYKQAADYTYRISDQIKTATKRLDDATYEYAKDLFTNIINAIKYWTGYTHIGCPKEKVLEKAYKAFFKSLLDFVLALKNSAKPFFRENADLILYQGYVYRYLGHHSPEDSACKIEPIYNDIYVSWSKEPDNSYIKSKLYGTMTWMSAEIREPNYGIDLEGLEEAIYQLVGIECSLTRGNEREVVFPTVEECITEIKYIKPEYEEDEEDDQT